MPAKIILATLGSPFFIIGWIAGLIVLSIHTGYYWGYEYNLTKLAKEKDERAPK